MGQYYLIVNLDKRQFLHPHRCGDGLHLLDIAPSGTGTLTALAILLADGNGRCFGDVRSPNPVIGSWAGDRIVIAGEYADDGKFTDDPARNLYHLARDEYEDVSRLALRAMADDPSLAEAMKRSMSWAGGYTQPVFDFAMGVPHGPGGRAEGQAEQVDGNGPASELGSYKHIDRLTAADGRAYDLRSDGQVFLGTVPCGSLDQAEALPQEVREAFDLSLAHHRRDHRILLATSEVTDHFGAWWAGLAPWPAAPDCPDFGPVEAEPLNQEEFVRRLKEI
jgi:hypothetical protein